VIDAPAPAGWEGLLLALLVVVAPESVRGWTRMGGTSELGTKGCALAFSSEGDLASGEDAPLAAFSCAASADFWVLLTATMT
jgi:hypothetical protein